MKKTMKTIIASALCTGLIILSGCSGKPEATKSFKITESTAAGNSGDVTLEKGDTYAVISIKDYGDIKIKLYPDLVPYAVYNFVELAKKGTYNGRNFHRIVEDFMIQGGSASGAGSGGKSIDGGEFKNDVNTALRHYYGALCYAASGLGDISDGFYIVNCKTPQTDLENIYDATSINYTYTASLYGQYAELINPSMEDYDKAYKLYTGIRDYNQGAVKAVTAMKKTITDAVKNTYAEKGGKAQLDGGYTVFGQTVEGFDVIDKITAVEKETGADGTESKPLTEIIIDKVEIFTME